MSHGKQPPGFRLPTETHVGRVALQVQDLDRSLEFYHGLLGFDVKERTSEGVLLNAADRTLIELSPGAARSKPKRRLGLYHFAILLPERAALGACLRRLLERGLHPGASDHLVSEALYLQDPDGLGIEIYRDRPQHEWRVVGQQLAMASDPLDFEGVLKAGEARPWQGMPPGTTIGHVHLHVGDLDHARAFYHEGLGLDLVGWSYPGALFLAAGGYHHHLGVNTWSGPEAIASPADEARLLWWDLVVPNAAAIQEAQASLALQGISAPPTEAIAIIADPWGTNLRLTTSA